MVGDDTRRLERPRQGLPVDRAAELAQHDRRVEAEILLREPREPRGGASDRRHDDVAGAERRREPAGGRHRRRGATGENEHARGATHGARPSRRRRALSSVARSVPVCERGEGCRTAARAVPRVEGRGRRSSSRAWSVAVWLALPTAGAALLGWTLTRATGRPVEIGRLGDPLAAVRHRPGRRSRDVGAPGPTAAARRPGAHRGPPDGALPPAASSPARRRRARMGRRSRRARRCSLAVDVAPHRRAARDGRSRSPARAPDDAPARRRGVVGGGVGRPRADRTPIPGRRRGRPLPRTARRAGVPVGGRGERARPPPVRGVAAGRSPLRKCDGSCGLPAIRRRVERAARRRPPHRAPAAGGSERLACAARRGSTRGTACGPPARPDAHAGSFRARRRDRRRPAPRRPDGAERSTCCRWRAFASVRRDGPRST